MTKPTEAEIHGLILAAAAELRRAAETSNEAALQLRDLVFAHDQLLVSEITVVAEIATLLSHAAQSFDRVAGEKLKFTHDSVPTGTPA